MTNFAWRPQLRTSEWALIGFFTYIAALTPFFPDRPNLSYQPVIILLVVFTGLWALACLDRNERRSIDIIRDWLPVVLTFAAFREMELFLPPHFGYRYETAWIPWDRFVLDHWRLRSAIESAGKLLPFYLELCYLLVYGVAAYCVGVLYAQRRRKSIDPFLTVYLAGTLAAYALFPYFPSQPPRIVFPQIDDPGVHTWARALNLYLLSKATIHVGVFPSAHVSSAFSCAWGMFLVLPERKRFGWGLVLYALSVSIATVYGRYHYAADVLAGFVVSLIAGAVCLWMRGIIDTQSTH